MGDSENIVTYFKRFFIRVLNDDELVTLIRFFHFNNLSTLIVALWSKKSFTPVADCEHPLTEAILGQGGDIPPGGEIPPFFINLNTGGDIPPFSDLTVGTRG